MVVEKMKVCWRHIKRPLVIAVFVYLGFGVLLTLAQHSFIYHPTPAVENPDLTEVVIETEGESLIINVLNPEQPKAVLYFGGNAEAVAYSASGFHRVFPGHTMYFMNYRGYGGSSGSPDEQSLYRDALSLYDRVKGSHVSVSVIGRSLGSGIATYAASKRDVSKLILVTPFDSITNVAAKHYPIYPVSLMLNERYDSKSRVPAISAPTLILVAGNDRVVDAFHAHQLAAAFPAGQVIKRVFQEEGHNSITSIPRYYELMREFL